MTGWQTYGVLRYFLLWCAVGAFILPWMVVRRHHVAWRRGEMTAIHGLVGGVLLLLNGVGYRPGTPAAEVHSRPGSWIALALMALYALAGARSADDHVPLPRKPPGI